MTHITWCKGSRWVVFCAFVAGVMGCAPYENGVGSSGSNPYDPTYSSNSPYNNPYEPRYGGGYDNYSSSRYPSSGYEQEYRKAQITIASQDSNAILNAISHHMLSSGWYPESTASQQALFTKARQSNGTVIYYKTVYTLVPTTGGYVAYANMRLKSTNSSLNAAAHKLDDKVEDILTAVKREVEVQQKMATPYPTPQTMSVTPSPITSTITPIPTEQPQTDSFPQQVVTPVIETVDQVPTPPVMQPQVEEQPVQKKEPREKKEKNSRDKKAKQGDAEEEDLGLPAESVTE